MADLKAASEYAVAVGVFRNELVRLLTNIKKKGVNNFTSNYLEERLRAANDLYREIRLYHVKLTAIIDGKELEQSSYTTDRVYETALDAFDTVETYIWEHLDRLNSDSSHHNQSVQQFETVGSSSPLRLPQIDLPSFSGDYSEWSSFHDIYRSMIHDNVNLPCIQKFHYLKSCLRGEASSILKSLAITSENYATAWNSLKARYQNKRIIVATLLNNFVQIPATQTDDLNSLKKLRDIYTVTLDSLRNVGYEVDSWSPLVIHLLVNKFDQSLRKTWEQEIRDLTEYPSFLNFSDFIFGRINMLESIGLATNSRAKQGNETRSLRSHNVSTSKPTCPSCSKDHLLFKCEKFGGLTPSARLRLVQSKQLCCNCLRGGHTTKSCRVLFRCKKCSKPHHTLLHLEDSTQGQKDSPARTIPSSIQGQDTSGTTGPSFSAHISSNDPRTVLLSTVLVRVEADNGRSVVARGLIDSGSEVSFISENLAQILRVKRTHIEASVFGLTGSCSHAVRTEAEVKLVSLNDNDTSLRVIAFVLQNITNYRPKSYDSNTFPELESLELADKFAISRAPIDLLIGADYLPQILLDKSLRAANNRLLAQSTIFGWVVSGILPTGHSKSISVTSHLCCDIDSSLRKFWEVEETPNPTLFLSEDDQTCESLFKEAVYQEPSGRFVVGLPFKPGFQKKLGHSRYIAEASLGRIITRLGKNAELNEQYSKFIHEYENSGHMSKVIEDARSLSAKLYLPHHAVFKMEDGKPKIRVVFNASCKTTSGFSLNDLLYIGPKLQKDITTILLNWRAFRYAGVTDIVKMFRQVLIRKQDRRFQNILWRDESGEIETYELNTVTYGTGPAPFLSMRVIQELALRHGDAYPRARNILLNSIYVDDVLFGAHTLTDFHECKDQLVQLFSLGKFELSKWLATVPLPELPANLGDKHFTDPTTASNKVLGVVWNPVKDTFHFSIFPASLTSLTKRILLSETAKVFDPMGWISPVTILLKQVMQSLWLLKLSWDDEIPETIKRKWFNVYNHLSLLNQVQIARWDHRQGADDSLELVGFCDASSLSYSAVVYARVVSRDGGIHNTLVMAKTKVAPLKTISIPRLELSAATLLTRLIRHVRASLNTVIRSIYCYSDSQITLAWIAQQPTKWNVFVANRVSFIQTELPEARWNHVSTKLNPADLNSRGVYPQDLLNLKLWWEGPPFLRELNLPSQTFLNTDEERRKITLPASSLNASVKLLFMTELITRFSSWAKLVRVMAYILRFIRKLKKGNSSFESYLSYQELQDARVTIIKGKQGEEFPTEIATIQKGESLPSRSRLIPLSPFLDSRGILRVGGRLRNSFLTETEKHPIILQPGHLTEIIVRSIHLQTLHGGLQLTLAILRKQYWVVHARNLVKKVIFNCVTCTRERPKLGTQYMGSLPEPRVSRNEAFVHTGVDYAGPFSVRMSQARNSKSQKAYIAVFVCFATRAIHLELVSSYDTASFLAAFSRFVGRRGKPAVMHSDNGLNFQGANAELRRAFKFALRDSAKRDSEPTNGIDWQFIPVATPHWGGLWESGVRAVKHHLRRSLGSFLPSFEEMCTILCRIEACLNSRPLCRLHDDVESLEYLTPGHFLTGRVLLAPPVYSTLNLKESALGRWQHVTRVVESFWKKWSSEYLTTLQPRSKWHKKSNPFQPGDVVILRNSLSPPCQWSMGRIIKMIPGVDEVSRVAVIKTANKEIQRSVTQLCKLPVTSISQGTHSHT